MLLACRHLFILLLFLPAVLFAGETDISPSELSLVDVSGGDEVAGYVARIELNDPAEVGAALARAEQLYLSGSLSLNVPPIAVVLHGPEMAIFFKENYQKYKSIVDLAARLSAFDVVDVKVCETRMSMLGAESKPLHPFVGTVTFGPAEIDRLVSEEEYEFF